MFSKRFWYLLFAVLCWIGIGQGQTAYADSPPNINNDIYWTDTGGTWNPNAGQFNATFNGAPDIQAAFNFARRQEETQLGLPSNCLGSLTLPVNYGLLSSSERGFVLVNAEREARGGMCGTNTDVLGLPFEGVEDNIEGLAESYANYLIAEDAFDHYADSVGPYVRIDNNPAIGTGACAGGADGHEYLSRAENLHGSWTTALNDPLPVERAIFNWMYASKTSNWGHRETLLLQDKDLSGNLSAGFNDNYGYINQEGFIGFAVADSNNYNPFDFIGMNFGTVVVFKMFDPVPESTNCGYGYTATAIELASTSTDGSDTAWVSQFLPLVGWAILLVTLTVGILKRGNHAKPD